MTGGGGREHAARVPGASATDERAGRPARGSLRGEKRATPTEPRATPTEPRATPTEPRDEQRPRRPPAHLPAPARRAGACHTRTLLYSVPSARQPPAKRSHPIRSDVQF